MSSSTGEGSEEMTLDAQAATRDPESVASACLDFHNFQSSRPQLKSLCITPRTARTYELSPSPSPSSTHEGSYKSVGLLGLRASPTSQNYLRCLFTTDSHSNDMSLFGSNAPRLNEETPTITVEVSNSQHLLRPHIHIYHTWLRFLLMLLLFSEHGLTLFNLGHKFPRRQWRCKA